MGKRDKPTNRGRQVQPLRPSAQPTDPDQEPPTVPPSTTVCPALQHPDDREDYTQATAELIRRVLT